MADNKKKSYSYITNYEVSGDKLSRKNKTCPKCGDGVFMASHKNRSTCGKCNYMEKKVAPKKDDDASKKEDKSDKKE